MVAHKSGVYPYQRRDGLTIMVKTLNSQFIFQYESKLGTQGKGSKFLCESITHFPIVIFMIITV